LHFHFFNPNKAVWIRDMRVYFRITLTFQKSCLNYARVAVVAVSRMWKAAKMQAGKFYSLLCYRGVLPSVLCVCMCVLLCVSVMQTKFKLCKKIAIYKFVTRIW